MVEQNRPKVFQPVPIDKELTGFSINRSDGNGVAFGDYPNGSYISMLVTEWDRKSPEYRLSIRAAVPLLGVKTEGVYEMHAGQAYVLNGTVCNFRTDVVDYKGLTLLGFTFQVPNGINVNRLEKLEAEAQQRRQRRT